MEFDIWVFFFFENLSRKFKFYKILINITATVPEDVFTLLISRSIFLRMESIWDKICCRGYQNTFYVLSFRFLTLQMGPIGRTETSVRNYHYSLRNNPEERSFPLLRGVILKSCITAVRISPASCCFAYPINPNVPLITMFLDTVSPYHAHRLSNPVLL